MCKRLLRDIIVECILNWKYQQQFAEYKCLDFWLSIFYLLCALVLKFTIAISPVLATFHCSEMIIMGILQHGASKLPNKNNCIELYCSTALLIINRCIRQKHINLLLLQSTQKKITICHSMGPPGALSPFPYWYKIEVGQRLSLQPSFLEPNVFLHDTCSDDSPFQMLYSKSIPIQ